MPAEALFMQVPVLQCESRKAKFNAGSENVEEDDDLKYSTRSGTDGETAVTTSTSLLRSYYLANPEHPKRCDIVGCLMK